MAGNPKLARHELRPLAEIPKPMSLIGVNSVDFAMSEMSPLIPNRGAKADMAPFWHRNST